MKLVKVFSLVTYLIKSTTRVSNDNKIDIITSILVDATVLPMLLVIDSNELTLVFKLSALDRSSAIIWLTLFTSETIAFTTVRRFV